MKTTNNTVPEGFVFVDWKDPQGNIYKDCVIKPQLEFMKANPNCIILKIVGDEE